MQCSGKKKVFFSSYKKIDNNKNKLLVHNLRLLNKGTGDGFKNKTPDPTFEKEIVTAADQVKVKGQGQGQWRQNTFYKLDIFTSIS